MPLIATRLEYQSVPSRRRYCISTVPPLLYDFNSKMNLASDSRRKERVRDRFAGLGAEERGTRSRGKGVVQNIIVWLASRRVG